MATPETVSNLNMTSIMTLNKSLSDDTDEMFKLQGINAFMRRIIKIAKITLHVKQYKDDDGVEHIDIEQIVTGGMKTPELRILNGEQEKAKSPVFGDMIISNRRITLDEIPHEFQKEDWLEEVEEHGLIESIASSDTEKSGKSWTVNQIWGFAMVDGARRHVRRLHFTGPNEEAIQYRIVYDYQGPNNA